MNMKLHALLLPTPELLSGFLKWSRDFVFSRFSTFFVVPGFGPVQKSMPDIHQIHPCQVIGVLGLSSGGKQPAGQDETT